MFERAYKAKFEWSGLPDGLTSIFVEDLILSSPNENFAVAIFNRDGIPEAARGEFWGAPTKIYYEQKYGRARRVQMVQYMGTTQIFDAKDVVMFDDFATVYRTPPTPSKTYIKAYTAMLAEINKAISQHVKARTLTAAIYADTQEEYKELSKLFERYDGVKVVKNTADKLFDGKKVNFLQFEVDAHYTDLAALKRNMEEDCFLRIGINRGIDKTHLTNYNIKDSEEAKDLINAYELKKREDFCRRYNEWGRGAHRLSVKIHNITADNSLSINKPTDDENGVQGAQGGAEGGII